MTLQEAFTKTVVGLLDQRQKSKREPLSSCVYRGEGGLKCGIGFMIEDRHYDPDIEDRIADRDEVLYCLERSGLELTEGLGGFLAKLQDIHDNRPVTEWEGALRYFTEHNNYAPLEYPEEHRFNRTYYYYPESGHAVWVHPNDVEEFEEEERTCREAIHSCRYDDVLELRILYPDLGKIEEYTLCTK